MLVCDSDRLSHLELEQEQWTQVAETPIRLICKRRFDIVYIYLKKIVSQHIIFLD